MKKLLLIVFALVSIGELFAGFAGIASLHMVCKPLILLVLGAYYLVSVGAYRSWWVILALLFSCAGDTLLLFDQVDALFFMGGLVAFLISHLFYIFAYRQHRYFDADNELQRIQKARLSFPILLAGTGLVVILFPVLGDLKIPVMAYALVLVLMVLNALFRLGGTNSSSFWLVFGGAVLFMISDSLLAVNKFLNPITHASLWVMLTYICAQYFIVIGLLRHPQPAD